jgi:hypothetical protein
MKKSLITLALATLIAPFAANATQENGIGYTYVQADYVNVSQSGHGGVADGGMLSGSYGFANNFQVFGSYSALNYDKISTDWNGYRISGDAKVKPWSLGFGYYASIGSRADWVTQVAYTHEKYSVHGCLDDTCVRANASDNVWAVNTGVMGRVTDKLTANAYLGYSHGPNVQGNVYGDFGLVYAFDTTWALHGGVRVNNDSSETYSVGVRASF